MVMILFAAEVFVVLLQRIFCDNVLKKREMNRYLVWLVWAAYFTVNNLVTYMVTERTGIAWLNMPVILICFFVTVRTLYTDSARTLLAVTVFIYLSGMCAELLVYYGCAALGLSSAEGLDLLCVLVSKILWFLLVKLVALLVRMRRKAELKLRDWLEVFIVPAGSVWILLAIYLSGTMEQSFFGFTAVLMVLIINIFTYYLYEKAKDTAERRMREELLTQQNAYYIRQDRESREWWEQLKLFRHNMSQYYLLERMYLEKKDYEALESFCRERLKSLEQGSSVSHTGNLYIDGVVNYKADMASKEGIELITDIQVPMDAGLSGEDLCLCLGNLLDNAVEAVRELPEGRRIRLEIKADHHNLYIRICNPYRNRIRTSGGRYLTGKADSRSHGLGLTVVRQIAEKYQGEMIVQDEAGEFEVLVLLYDFLN